MNGPQDGPVPGQAAHLRQAAVECVLIHLAQDLRIKQAAHRLQVPRDGGVLGGKVRVVRAAVYNTQGISGQGGVQATHLRRGGVPEVHEYQAAGAGGQLVHKTAGLTEIDVLGPLGHLGNFHGRQGTAGKQCAANTAQQHLKGGAAGEAGAGQHIGLHPGVEALPEDAPPGKGGGHAPDQGGTGVPLPLPGGQLVQRQGHRVIAPGKDPDNRAAGQTDPGPGGAVNGGGQDAAALVVRMVAAQLHPAGSGKDQLVHGTPLHRKSWGTRCVPQLAVCLIYLMPAATMQSKTRVSTTNTAATHLVPRASLASMLLALERLI